MLCHQGLDLLVDYDFVAIFDADFKPEPDFLVRLPLHATTKCARINAQVSPSAGCWCFIRFSKAAPLCGACRLAENGRLSSREPVYGCRR